MRFNLEAMVPVSAYTIVEASSLEEAIRIAEDRDVVIFNGRCGEDAKEVWIIEEADGSPEDIHSAV